MSKQDTSPFVLAEDLTAYCLRHRYASDMIAKGIPKEVVSLIMGHADIDITDIYIKLTREMIDDALAKLNPIKDENSPENSKLAGGKPVGRPTT